MPKLTAGELEEFREESEYLYKGDEDYPQPKIRDRTKKKKLKKFKKDIYE